MPAEFLKEGTLFMNRCTSTTSASEFCCIADTTYRARQEGVHQDLASSRNWFLDHGSVPVATRHVSRTTINSANRRHRLHRQARPHSRQQHPRRRLIVSPSIPHALSPLSRLLRNGTSFIIPFVLHLETLWAGWLHITGLEGPEKLYNMGIGSAGV
jgi:hypothetical protein